MRQIGPGMVQQLQARCPDCSGGYKVTMKKERQVLEVNVDKGATHNTKLRFSGMGNEQPNTEPGELCSSYSKRTMPCSRERVPIC